MLKKSILVLVVAAFFSVLNSNPASAVFFDEDKTLELKGKLQARGSWRTEASEGYTFPKMPAGNMVQQRNLALIELNHELLKKSETAPELKYHILGRFLYDGLYDYGPKEFRDVREANKATIDDFKKSAELWEAYVDYAQGRGFLRIGRQNVSWGETDIFQLLDRINPLDNTFGGTFEDLDDRRIPLWMARGTYNLGKIGPVSNVTLEGFFNPGFASQKVAPIAPYGTPYAYPSQATATPVRVFEPEKTFDDSRMGVRLQGVIADNFNFSLAHYKTIVDTPAAILSIVPTLPGMVAQDLIYRTEQVTGATLNFYEPNIDAIIRAEVAWMWNESIFIPEVNMPALFGNLVSGMVPTKDVFRYMVGLDKTFWIRPLNNRSMFNVYIQYFAELYPNYDDRMRVPVARFPTGEFVKQVRYDQKITMIISNSWRGGTIVPQLAVAYDPRGAILTIPSIEYQFDPWRLKLSYYRTDGANDVSLGILRDRDQVSVQLTLLF